jgi:hypothetical protein
LVFPTGPGRGRFPAIEGEIYYKDQDILRLEIAINCPLGTYKGGLTTILAGTVDRAVESTTIDYSRYINPLMKNYLF